MTDPVHVQVPDDLYDDAFASVPMRRAAISVARHKVALTPMGTEVADAISKQTGIPHEAINVAASPADTELAWKVMSARLGLSDRDANTVVNGLTNSLMGVLSVCPPDAVLASLRGFICDALMTGHQLRIEQEKDTDQ